MQLKFKVLKGGTLPTRAHRTDAGFDLYLPKDFIQFESGMSAFIKLRVCVEIPKDHVGFIMGRSSLNKKGIVCLTGVIDSGYTGEIATTLMNMSPNHYVFFKGERIAQLVVAKLADIDDAVSVDKLDDTERGAGGFGSTGA